MKSSLPLFLSSQGCFVSGSRMRFHSDYSTYHSFLVEVEYTDASIYYSFVSENGVRFQSNTITYNSFCQLK